MGDGPALLAAILDHPGEHTARLAYADWLQEGDQPERAEFIRVQCSRAAHGREANRRARAWRVEDARLAAREAALLATRWAEWLLPIARLLRVPESRDVHEGDGYRFIMRDQLSWPDQPRVLPMQWRGGFAEIAPMVPVDFVRPGQPVYIDDEARPALVAIPTRPPSFTIQEIGEGGVLRVLPTGETSTISMFASMLARSE